MRLINVDTQVPLLRAPLRYEVKKLSREIIRNVEQKLLLLYLVIVPLTPREL